MGKKVFLYGLLVFSLVLVSGLLVQANSSINEAKTGLFKDTYIEGTTIEVSSVSPQIQAVNELYTTCTPSTQKTKYDDGTTNLIMYSSSVFDDVECNTLSDVSSVRWINGGIEFSYRGYSIHLIPSVIYNGQEYSVEQIKQAFPSINLKEYLEVTRFNHKYAFNFTGIPENIANNIDYFKFYVNSFENLTGEDFNIQGTDVTIKNRILYSFQDLKDHGYTLNRTDARTLLIGNVSAHYNNGEIFLDPSIQLIQTTDFKDASIRSTSPVDNFDSSSNKIYCSDGASPCGDAYKSLFKFNLTNNIPASSNITNCDLWIYPNYVNSGAGADANISAHQLLKDWVYNQVTWSIYSTGNNWGTAGARNESDINFTFQDTEEIPSASSWYGLNLDGDGTVNLCQQWFDGDTPNYGVLLRTYEPDSYTDVDSYNSEYTVDLTLRPYINITYESPDPCSEGVCDFDYRYLLSDINLCESGIGGNCGLTSDLASQSKWEISDYNCSLNTTSAYINYYISAKSGSPSNSAKIEFVADESWDERSTASTISSQTVRNSTTPNMNSTTVGTWASMEITTQFLEACALGQNTLSLRAMHNSYPVTSVATVEEGTTTKLGHAQFLSDSYFTFPSRTGTTNQKPSLTIYYEYEDAVDNDPTVTILSPANNTNSTNSSFVFSCSATDDIDLVNLTLNVWNSTGLFNTTTNSSASLGTSATSYFNVSNFVYEQKYTWNCEACDDGDQCSVDIYNDTLNILPSFNIFINETVSDVNITKTDKSSISVEWYSNPVVNFSSCYIEINNGSGGVNYSGTISNNTCNATISELEGLNWTYKVHANDSINRQRSTESNWVYINLDPSGYWIMRAPVNQSNIYNGISTARRHGGAGAPKGNGRDVGVLWRADTLDNNGVNGTDAPDEERHCGAWTQFYFDEIGYDQGNISNIYCHMWMYTEGGSLDYGEGSGVDVIGIGTGGQYTSGSYYDTDRFDSTPAYPTNATNFHLQIYWKEDLGLEYDDDYNFTGNSFKGSGKLVQMMSYRSQRSFCLINVNLSNYNETDQDGDGLTDLVEMNVTYTDPYDTDTDNDGHDDYQEWINNKSGVDPYDWGVINVIKLNETTGKAYLRERNNQSSPLTPLDYMDTLDREFITSEYENLSFHDSDCPILDTCTNATVIPYYQNSTHHFSHTQINYYYNISSVVNNLSNIINFNLFHGGITISQNNYDSTELNKTLTIMNVSGGTPAIVPSKVGHTNAFYLKQLKDNVDDFINTSDGTMRIRVETSNADSQSDITFGWGEIWVITGSNELNITSPHNDSYLTVNESDEITVNFTFQEEGETITAGVSIDSITINDSVCTNTTSPFYTGTEWSVNCSIPCLETSGEFVDLNVTASSTSVTLSDIQEEPLYYEEHEACDTCTYSSGDWNIDCSDYCDILTEVDVGGNDIIITQSSSGAGSLIFRYQPINFGNIISTGFSATDMCFVQVIT